MSNLRKNWLIFILVLLYIPYVLLYLFENQYSELIYLEGLPAVAAIIILLKFGKFSRKELYLRIKKISRTGVYMTSIVLGFFVIVGFFGKFSNNPVQIFILLTPLSAITQELYFRCSLQVSFEQILSLRSSNLLQTVFFIWWHLRLFLLYPFPLAWLGLIFGLGFIGFIWGYQSRMDGTILYVMLIHIIGLIGQTLLIWDVTFL